MDKFQRQVASKCANYDKNGLCILETDGDGCRSCPLFSELNKRCIYYELSVLPENDKLETEYRQRLGVVFENSSTCESCGQLYERRSNAQKYCTSCGDLKREERRRQQNRRAYQRKKEKQL